MIQLQEYLTERAPDLSVSLLEQVQGRIKVLIADLVGQPVGRGPFAHPAPAYAGLRGEEEGPLVYRAGGIEIVLEVQQDADQPDHRALLGLVLGGDLSGLKVYLWQAGQQIAQTAVDTLGNFVFVDLLPGSYDLILSGPDAEIHVQELAI
jgi:hypothetical protein